MVNLSRGGTLILIGARAHGRIVAEATALSGFYNLRELAGDNPARQGLLKPGVILLRL